MSHLQVEAEKLLDTMSFEEAAALVSGDEADDSRFQAFAAWKQDFKTRLERAQHSAYARNTALVAEALRHEAAFDYKSAVQALERISPSLLDYRADQAAESAGEILARVKQKYHTVQRLESAIRRAIAEREVGNILPKVVQLLDLCPHRTDVAKIKRQLEEREAKLTLRRREEEREQSIADLRKSVETAMRMRQYGTATRLLKAFVADASPDSPFLVESSQLLAKCKRDWNRASILMWLWTASSFLLCFIGGLIVPAIVGLFVGTFLGMRGQLLTAIFGFFASILFNVANTGRNIDKINQLGS